MTEKEKQQQHVNKRSRYQPQRKMNESFNRLLNYLIGIVVALIAIALFVIFLTEPEKIEPTKQEAEEATPVEEEGGRSDEEEPAVSEEESDDASEEDATDEANDEEEPSLAGKDVTVEKVDDDVVSERWTSESWEPYPTEQEGPHASVYQKGHIDYEEKLAAVYSVIPLEQSKSILLRIQNNGSPQTARAVVTNMDKTESYRVFIEWVDGEGWQPTMVEVLTSLDSIK